MNSPPGAITLLCAQSIRSPWWLQHPPASHRVVISHSISPSHVDKPRRHLISFARLINSLPIPREQLLALQSTGNPGLLGIRAVDFHSRFLRVRPKPEGHGLMKKQNTQKKKCKKDRVVFEETGVQQRCLPTAHLSWMAASRRPRAPTNRRGEKEATTPSGNVSDFLSTAFHCCKTQIAGEPEQVCPLKRPQRFVRLQNTEIFLKAVRF